MKPIPPPIPNRFPGKLTTVSAPGPLSSGIERRAPVLGLLVALLAIIFVLLLFIIVLTSANIDDSQTTATADSGFSSNTDLSSIGVNQGKSSTTPVAEQVPSHNLSEAGAKRKALNDELTATGTTPTPTTQDTAVPADATNPEEQPAVEEPLVDQLEEMPMELSKGARLYPLVMQPSAPTIHSLETNNPLLQTANGDSVVFVIDKSSSISGRFERVLSALSKAIENLNSSQSFQLIFFDQLPWQHPTLQGLVSANTENKAAIAQWVNTSISANGGTDPLAAVLRAIELKPARIVILSDGEFDASYAAAITKANSMEPRRRIRIDCIGLDEVVISLQEIAKQNGPGNYYQAQ